MPNTGYSVHVGDNVILVLFILVFVFFLISQGFLGLFGWNTVDPEAKEVSCIPLPVCFQWSALKGVV